MDASFRLDNRKRKQNQKEKAKIRATPEWKHLKENVRNSQGCLDALHFMYSYYKHDPQIIFRLQNLLYAMKEAENANRS